MKRVMLEFNETYHRGASVGYAYGLHHDTAHLRLSASSRLESVSSNFSGEAKIFSQREFSCSNHDLMPSRRDAPAAALPGHS
ncbi:MAG: hypothetical protein WCE49_14935, partial [Terrimicrobiaceae bacterium]